MRVNGNCDSPDGMNAGGHNASTGGRAPGSETHHLGDLGNIVADESGRADVNVTVSGVTIALMGAASIGDRSIVGHAKENDYSDPAGNLGARVACGVIEFDMMRM